MNAGATAHQIKPGYRLGTPEEREVLNRLGSCWIVRELPGRRPLFCPNPRVDGSDRCAHHGASEEQPSLLAAMDGAT